MATDASVELGQRINSFRKRLSLTQKDLASQMGFGSGEIISQIEKGTRELKAWELVKLSKILLVDLFDLLSTQEPELEPLILWRESPRDQKELKEVDFLRRCQQYATLEELTGGGHYRPFPQKKAEPDRVDFHHVLIFADDIRQEFALGDRPALSLEKTLQDRYGVKIWYTELDEGSAASTIGSFGPAVLMNKNQAPWRRNYNFAHELFHLITWNSIPPGLLLANENLWNKIEKIANAFASYLLLPGDSVNEKIEEHLADGKIEYVDLVEIARSFDVSTEALVFRLINLRVINEKTANSLLEDEDFRNLDRSTMAHNWWTPPKFPERFVRLAFLAYQKGRLSKAKLAQFLDTSLLDLTDTLQEYGLDDHKAYSIEVCAA